MNKEMKYLYRVIFHQDLLIIALRFSIKHKSIVAKFSDDSDRAVNNYNIITGSFEPTSIPFDIRYE